MPDSTQAPYDVLHVGRSKCASTYLQKVALATHPGIELYFEQHKELFHQYWNYDFGEDADTFVNALRARMPAPVTDSSKVRVFSHETLTGHMFHGRNARLIADLTLHAFGPMKVFMIVREPYAYIYSVWNQHVQEGGVMGLRDFLLHECSPSWCRTSGQSRVWGTAMNTGLIRYWLSNFGESNVRIFLLEDLPRKGPDFWRELYGFIGVDPEFEPQRNAERSAYPHSLAQAKLRLNRLVKSQHNPGAPLPHAMHTRLRRFGNRLASRIKGKSRPDPASFASEEIKRRIREDNRALADLLGRDLGALGYDLG